MISRPEIKVQAKSIMRSELGTLALGLLLGSLSIAAGFIILIPINLIPILGTIAWFAGVLVLNTVVIYGNAYMALSAVKGIPIKASDIFILLKADYIRQISGPNVKSSSLTDLYFKNKIFINVFVISLLTGTIAGVIPFIGWIASIIFLMGIFASIDNPHKEIEQYIKESLNFCYGYKADLVILALSFFGWTFLSAFTFGILLFWLVPYILVSYAVFYAKRKAGVYSDIKRPEMDSNGYNLNMNGYSQNMQGQYNGSMNTGYSQHMNGNGQYNGNMYNNGYSQNMQGQYNGNMNYNGYSQNMQGQYNGNINYNGCSQNMQGQYNGNMNYNEYSQNMQGQYNGNINNKRYNPNMNDQYNGNMNNGYSSNINGQYNMSSQADGNMDNTCSQNFDNQNKNQSAEDTSANA